MPEKSKSQKQEREELTLTFKPSARRRTESQPGELNQLPVMNLMIILIPVLLAQSAAVKLSLHEVNLPTGGGAGGGTATEEVQKEEEQLSLTVNITTQGFDIISAFGRGEADGLSVPMKGGEYDYETLNEKLMAIKKQIGKSGIHFVDAGNVIVMGEPGIKYDVIVHVMDAAKWGEDETGGRISLFPGMLLSPGKVQIQ
ncbi:MAG: biopolymer transporter ExbD [Candidatus Latescibacteria bacterium]|nr:biopolymer transporter ExbD [Candidatus Latescibacterota bacterium]